MLKSYSLKHERGEELLPLLKAYRDAVNGVLEELWENVEWKKKEGEGKEAVEALTEVRGGHPQRRVQEGAQGQPALGLALRSTLG